MNDLILDHKIIHAGPLDFWPIQEKGRGAVPACFDLLYGSGHLRLTHATMQDWVFVTPELIRITLPEVVNMTLFRKGMAIGGALRAALVDLRCAAIVDRGILSACGEVRHELQSLAEPPTSPGVDQEANEFDDPVMKPYDRWWYGIERNGNEAAPGDPQVVAIPIAHVNRARERNPNLAINELYHLMADGLSPVMAKIGVPRQSADYAAVRSEWIEIAIESLLANIEDAVKGWPVLPGEPFQNVVVIDGNMFFITLDTIDGLTVVSPTASKQAVEQFTREVHRVAHSRLARGLATLRRAIVS
jgi:hypothetical protein